MEVNKFTDIPLKIASDWIKMSMLFPERQTVIAFAILKRWDELTNKLELTTSEQDELDVLNRIVKE